MMEAQKARRTIRILLSIFTAALFASGLTAIPLRWELALLDQIVRLPLLSQLFPALLSWVSLVHEALKDTLTNYPFLAYGTDWLAFGHIVIAISFIGALKDPVKNRWVLQYGMIACLLVIPWALVFGALRGIPLFWRLVDSSFGVFGIIPLWISHRLTRRLEAQEAPAAAPQPA